MPRTIVVGPDGNRRLAWIKVATDSAFWDSHWESLNGEELLKAASSDKILLGTFLRNIPEGARVLEAGCGLGQWVELLSRHGRDAVGIDYAEKAVKTARKLFGGDAARFTAGDIRKLPFPDSSFDAVISLGVVEHFKEGPDELLREMARIIRPGGVLLASTPYFNPFRLAKGTVPGTYLRGWPGGRDDGFYQFAYTRRELAGRISSCGFTIRETVPYSTVKGLTDELPFLGRIRRKASKAPGKTGPQTAARRGKSPARRLASAILESVPFRTVFGHMLMVVGVKK